MARRKRVVMSPEAKREANVRAWQNMAGGSTDSYAGFRPCPVCGAMAYCRGTRFDKQKCFECFVTP